MNFNWKPQKLPLQMINGNSRAASEAMAGYVPAEADPNNPYYTQGIPAENAAALMQGYTEEQPAPYVGRTPENMNNAGQGEGYQFNDPEYNAYMQQQEKAANEAAAKEQKIADIKSQIQTLETRIAENTKKLQGWGGVANQIAALEARKINSQDPTMVWRWKAQQDAAKEQRLEDRKRIEAEKKLAEEKNLKINRNKIDNILQSTMPTKNMTRDKMDMAVKQLNDAEELAKNYGDTDAMKKINERKNELGIYVPVDDEANVIESDFVKNMEMVGKKGGMSKKQFAKYVQSVLDDPKNKHIWEYSRELQHKLYAAIGKNTGAKPTNYAGY